MKTLLKTLFLLLIGIQASAQGITQWQGPNRDGTYNEKGLMKQWPAEGPKLLWHFDELADGHASAAVTSSAVYTAGMVGDQGFIYAFDHSGKLLWKTNYGAEWTENWNGVRATPVVYNDKLYQLSTFGKLVCLDSKTGQILWTVDAAKDYGAQKITWGITENLVIDGDIIYCIPGGTEAAVVALNRTTGKQVWAYKGTGEKSAYNSPALINLPKRKVLVTMTEKTISGIDAASGTLLWTVDQPNQWSVHANTPIYKDGMLFCVSGYGKGSVMLKLADDGSSATEAWRDNLMDPKMGGVVVLDGKIYGAADKDRKMYCLDWNTGKVIYAANILGPGNIISDEGLLYFYSESGNVALIEPKTDSFNVISSFKVPFGANQHWAHLVIFDKKLYVRHGTSLMVYDIASK